MSCGIFHHAVTVALFLSKWKAGKSVVSDFFLQRK